MGHRQSLILGSNKLKLGLFSPNCSGGMAVTKVEERWQNTWENNIKLAQLADEAGLEFMLPIARWIGYGGETDFHGSVLETITWATGLLANTRRINVFATVHSAFIHPVVAAKQLATIDQLGRGRLGLNVVAGWNKPEYEAFGIDLPDAHADRYELAQEWYDVVQRIWNHDGPFDWNGKYFKLKGVYGYPRPFDGSPPIMNAAGSGEGRQFAARNADFLFKISNDFAEESAEVTAIE
ncbi:MAG: alkanesulfonate monooxygenase SsuD, partial [Bacteroidia bacterium]